MSQTVTAYQYAPNAEIVIVLESSKEMERSGKLANTRDAVKDFVTVFDGHRKADSGVTFGFIPFGNDLVNVAPHTEWLEGGVWPVEIPPKVPGTVTSAKPRAILFIMGIPYWVVLCESISYGQITC